MRGILVAIAVLLTVSVSGEYTDDRNDAIVIEAGSSHPREGKQLELVTNALDLTYQFRAGQGACLTSKGVLGKCANLRACYPFYQIPASLPNWAYGSKESCSHGEGKDEFSGVCCSAYQGPYPGIVASAGAPTQQQDENFIYPASTIPLSREFKQFPGGLFQGGGFPSGQFPGGFPGGQYPGGFPGGQPGGFPGGQPGGFPGGQPGGFPGGFPGQFPGGFPPQSQQPLQPPPQWPQEVQQPSPQWPQEVQQPSPQWPSSPVVEEQDEEVITGQNQILQENIARFSECGTNKYSTWRVAGGEPARRAEFPWTVALFNRGRQFCGGSLISPTHILTAAHCVAQMTSEDAKAVTVRLGDHNLDDPSESITVEKSVKLIVKNKLFSMQTLHHDVAIVVMDSPVTYADNIRPICLASGGNFEGESVTVSGWGLLRENGPRPTMLQKLTMKAWNQDECKRVYTVGSPAGITPHMLCAGQKGMDSCSGDSGGPLVHETSRGKMEQVGIVSWGIGCGKDIYPGVYTRVTEMREWISKVMSSY